MMLAANNTNGIMVPRLGPYITYLVVESYNRLRPVLCLYHVGHLRMRRLLGQHLDGFPAR